MIVLSRSLFGALNVIRSVSDLAIVTDFFSRFTSVQRNATTSPRRAPVYTENATAG